MNFREYLASFNLTDITHETIDDYLRDHGGTIVKTIRDTYLISGHVMEDYVNESAWCFEDVLCLGSMKIIKRVGLFRCEHVVSIEEHEGRKESAGHQAAYNSGAISGTG